MERTVLLYNFTGKRLQCVKKSLMMLGCAVKAVRQKDFDLTIGEVLGQTTEKKTDSPKIPGFFKDEMLVMYGFEGEMIDVLIAALKMGGVGKIDLKAIVTDHNINWSGTRLYKEIKAEHNMMNKTIRE